MAELRQITSSAQWIAHFASNAARQREVPWHLGADASDEELALISSSLRGWQLGETSDGSHLLSAARNYAHTTGDDEFIQAAQLFIAEEQRHGANLGRFLDLAGIARAKFDWGDWLFRSVRYFLPVMEVWATPVLMVETHAMIYYNALRVATRSRVLKAICRQILSDEVPHIRFQCERLAIVQRRRPAWLLGLTKAAQVLFFAVVTLAVWIGHHRVLRAGGYPFHHFWKTSWRRMQRAWKLTSPSAYRWPSAELPRDRSLPWTGPA
jgi:hypothetical protein